MALKLVYILVTRPTHRITHHLLPGEPASTDILAVICRFLSSQEQPFRMNNKYYSAFSTIGIIASILLARSEINTALSLQEEPGMLYSPLGILTISLYAILFLAGILSLLIGFWSASNLQRLVMKFESGWLGWLVVFGCLVVVTWTYLFSSWQFILQGPWMQLIFVLGFTRLVGLLLSPRRAVAFNLDDALLAMPIFLFPRIVNEVRLLTDSSLASRTTVLLGYIIIVLLTFLLYHPVFERIRPILRSLRERLGKLRWLAASLLLLTPIFHHYLVGAEIYILYPNLRFAILLLALWIVSFLTCEQKDRLVSISSLMVNFFILILVSAVNGYLLLVVDYPFGLYWSEGNRLYDYSLVFGQSLYNYPGRIINPYSSPGRYGLWGVMFLFDGLPIWAHRLWNLVLQIVPPLLFSILATRKVQPAGLRNLTMLWIALFFIVLAPLHPPFMLASVIVAWFAFDKSPVKRGASLLVSGYYVAISRWTWAFAPAAMGALIDLFLHYPRRTGNWFRRLVPTLILVILGAAPGLYINFNTFQSTIQGDHIAVKQPLLWYRLLPNDTLGPGVLFLALLYTTPLLIFIAWWMFTKQWKLDVWQKLAVWGALTGFFAVGLVISTKIGGGGDLHNLDMYLVTLMLVCSLGLTQISTNSEKIQLPACAISLVVLLIFLPIYRYTPLNPAAATSSRLNVPANAQAESVLAVIRTEVENASEKGEVLFMDQRQLLTFGQIPAIPFVPEYEKKYMMDQAMANNTEYFQSYYRDLASKRFRLIVTEILRSKLKIGMGGPFSEENDAFVTWVSNPTLCFYEPIYTSKETNVMLLVPRALPKECNEYLK